MTDTQYHINFCFRVGLMVLFILSGTRSDPDLTITVPSTAYPGDTIQLACNTSIPGLTYKWVANTNVTLSYSQTFSYTFPKMIYFEEKTFTCQVLLGNTVVAQESQEVKVALVSSVTFDIRGQDLNNLNKVVIQCFATSTVSGVVALTWYFNTIEIVASTAGYQIVDETLTISATDPARSGLYVCSATLDGVDSTKKSQSTKIQIYSPPEVSLEQPEEGDVFYLLENSLFKITCNITGLETPSFEWLVNDRIPDNSSVTVSFNLIEPDKDSLNLSTSLASIQSSLTFTQVKLDLESIKCSAFNTLGIFEAETAVIVDEIGRPCAPVDLHLLISGSTWIELEWRLNSECEPQFQFASSFLLEYEDSAGLKLHAEYILIGIQTSEEIHSVILTSLKPNTPYKIRVSAKNEYGASEYTDYIIVVTSPVDKKVIFNYGKENGDSEMEHGYYTQSPALQAAAAIPVGTRRIESVYVSPFGTLSLDRRSYSWYPRAFLPTSYTRYLFLLAPFWSDIDYRERGAISYRVYQTGNIVHNQVLERATILSRSHADADTNFTALAVIVATWARVEPWGYASVFTGVNTFQAAIVTDYEQSYVLFGYICGEMSWSSSATYPTSPVIGFNAGGAIYKNHALSYMKTSHEIACKPQKSAGELVVVAYKISSDMFGLEGCLDWFKEDALRDPNLLTQASSADPCPCNFFQAIFDSRYRFDFVAYYSSIYKARVYCFVSRFPAADLYQRCCYDLSPDSPSAGFVLWIFTPVVKSGRQRGSILSTNPVFSSQSSETYQLYKERDEEGYVQCCHLSDKCEQFYKRRPSQDCSGYVPRPFTWGFGDPHVISMDGFKYTFNGIGEYWYLFPIGECDFDVQARTQPIRDTAATVFTGIAVRVVGCSTVFVSLLGRDELALFVDNQNKTDEIHSTGELMNSCLNIEYVGSNSTHKAEAKVVYANGAFISLRAEGELISITISLPDNCEGRTQGLIGQWDGDASNDLLMRNGTLLSENVTDREKEVFAESWRLTEEESFMVYETGNYSTYNPSYTPGLYLDELLEEANISSEVLLLCNGDAACLFDAVVTNDTSIAMGTVFISVDTQEMVAEGNNIPPLILTPPSMLLSLDNLTTFEFNVTDGDPFSVNVALSPQFAFTDITLENVTVSQYRLQLRLTDIPVSMNVTIIANDSVGASVVSVYVVVCHCDNGGYCSEVVPGTALGESGYIRSSCQCPLMYEGMYCSDAVADPCLQTACEAEICPFGTFKNNLSKCEDINECEATCNQALQVCNNTYGSYICSCVIGYVLVADECVDFDECSLLLSPCQHNCNNSIGSYTCSCDPYYSLEPDMSTCRGDSVQPCTPGLIPPYNCDECITVGTDLVCAYCEIGTELSSNGMYCEDLDECTLQSGICPSPSSRCVNEFASYYCSCNQGYSKNSEGVCVDVDECLNSVCDISQLCSNTPGSFICASYCYLPTSYILPNGECAMGNESVVRSPVEPERLIILFSLSLTDLEEALDNRGLSLSSLYTALSSILYTPLEEITFSRTQTPDGLLQLDLTSESFQVDPTLLTGILQTDLLSDWAPYVAYVKDISADTISITPAEPFPLATLIIVGLISIGFLMLFLLALSFLFVMCSNRIDFCFSKYDREGSTREKLLLNELTSLRDKRAVVSQPVSTAAKTHVSNWPKGSVLSNRLLLSSLSYLLAEDPPLRVYNEFEKIPMHLATVDDVPPACEFKNRFKNILPPPHTRVPLFLKYGLPHSDYINANFIRGYKMAPRVYIATQAPMFNTEQDFWRMIWEHNTKVIIMLTEMVERDREKCIPYWPDKDIILSIRSGEINIISKKKIIREDYQIQEFILEHINFEEVHEVTHYWYRKWPEYGVPSNPNSLVSFLLETRTEPRTSSNPVVVHCASGTGRTGVVLAVDIGMQELEERHSVDILHTVSLLRQDRSGLIQTRDQYHLIYKSLCSYARYIEGQGENKIM